MSSQLAWRRGLVAVAALALATGVASPAGAAGATGSVSAPVVSGLIGPLGLAVTANGTIYVAETFAGRLTRVLPNGTRTALLESPTLSPNGVDVQGLGRVVTVMSIFPEDPSGPPEDTTIERVRPNGTRTLVASLLDYEVANNPDAGQTYGLVGLPPGCASRVPPELLPYTGIVESNPYKVTVVAKDTYAVADAAGNSILRVSNGVVSTVAVLPPIPQRITLQNFRQLGLPLCTVGRDYQSEPVPTDVEAGPDGYWYVSALPGGPELPGYGSVYRVDPSSGSVELVTRGLSGATDLAVADDGTIYVAELFANRITAVSDGSLSTVVDVFSPGAVEFDPNGTLYATVGVFGPAGDVVIVTP